MTKRIVFVLIALWAVVAYVLYQTVYNVDPVEVWAQQATGSWDISNENGSAELTLDADGNAHLYVPAVTEDQREWDVQGTWRIAYATREMAILEFDHTSGIEDWIAEYSAQWEIEDPPLKLNKVFYYLELGENGAVIPVMGGIDAFGVGWTPFRDADWEPSADWNEALVGHWRHSYFSNDELSRTDPVQFHRDPESSNINWNTEVRADGTWNWRLDPDIGTWQVLHELSEYAVVEFVETGDEARRILTFQKLHPNGAISTIMYTGYHGDDTITDHYRFERVD